MLFEKFVPDCVRSNLRGLIGGGHVITLTHPQLKILYETCCTTHNKPHTSCHPAHSLAHCAGVPSNKNNIQLSYKLFLIS